MADKRVSSKTEYERRKRSESSRKSSGRKRPEADYDEEYRPRKKKNSASSAAEKKRRPKTESSRSESSKATGSRKTAASRSTAGAGSSSNRKQRPPESSSNRSRNQPPSNSGRRRKRKKKKSSKLFLTLQLLILMLFATCVILIFQSGLVTTFFTLYDEANEKVAAADDSTFTASQTTVIYDKNGDILTKVKSEKELYYLTLDQLPQEVADAYISIEDKRFYKHGGYDIKGIARALVSIVNSNSISQGGSTITQQLSRNIFLTHTVSWERKAEEILISRQLEKKFTKDQILEYYINNIYYASGYYGIQAASLGYFGCDVNDLSLSQIAFLCAIPNSPSMYNPREYLENTLTRRDTILSEMLEDGKITQSQYQEAISEEIKLVETKTNSEEESINLNYVNSYVKHCAVLALMEQRDFEFQYKFSDKAEKEAYEEAYNELYTECQSSLYNNGYQIYTSIDLDLQQTLQESVDLNLQSFETMNVDGSYALQASAACIDNETGFVSAIVGGRSQEGYTDTLNRAFQSFRQPGSAIKPLIVYGPALENGYSASSTVKDVKIEDGPENSNSQYSGNMTLRRAVEVSKNTVAWNLFVELTPEVGLAKLYDMNFTKIEKTDEVPAASLGGFTNGVSAVEMASGYAALQNNGAYRTPTCITSITYPSGEIVALSEQTPKQVYTEEAAIELTDILKGVMTNGTGKALRVTNVETAGKTGTTNDNKDGWFVGFSDQYTTSVWVGYDTPRTLPGLAGSSYPGSIWNQFMEIAHGNDFEFDYDTEPEE